MTLKWLERSRTWFPCGRHGWKTWSKTTIIHHSFCGWHRNDWKEAEHGSHVEDMDEKRGQKQRLFITVFVYDIEMTGKKQNMVPMWKTWMKNVVKNNDYSSQLLWMTSKCLERSRTWFPCGRHGWKTWSKTTIILHSFRGWHRNGWKEAEHGSHVEDMDEKRGEKQRLFFTVFVDDIEMAGKKQNMVPMWKTWMKNVVKNNDYSSQFLWMTSKWLERSRTWFPCGRHGWKTWSKTTIIHHSFRGWHRNGWKEAEHGSHVEDMDEKRGQKQRLFITVFVDDIEMIGKKQNMVPMWKTWMKNVVANNDYSSQFSWMTSKWLERSRTWFPCGRHGWKTWSKTTIILHSFCGWHRNDWKEAEHGSHVEDMDEKRGLWWNHIISWSRIFGMCSTWMQTEWNQYWGNKNVWHVFLLEQLKNTRVAKTSRTNGSVFLRCGKDVLEHALKDIASRQTKKWSSSTCRKNAHKLSWSVCTWHELGDQTFFMVCQRLARAVTKWTQACDRRLARLISYMHHTNDCRQYCHVGNMAKHCRLGLFQDSDSAGDLEDSKSTSGRVLCTFGSRTFVTTSWMCKKQTSVSHSSTESEIISLDAGLRMDGLLALDFWDVVLEVLPSTNNDKRQIRLAPGNWCGTGNHKSNKTKTKTPTEKSNRDVDQLSNVDYIPTNTQFLSRRVSVAHLWRQQSSHQDDYQRTKSNNETRVQNPQSCSGLVVRQNQFRTKIQIRYVDTKNQLADMLTRGSFTRESSSSFFSTLWISRCSLPAISVIFFLIRSGFRCQR